MQRSWPVYFLMLAVLPFPVYGTTAIVTQLLVGPSNTATSGTLTYALTAPCVSNGVYVNPVISSVPFKASPASTWSSTVIYTFGQTVSYLGTTYVAIAASTNQLPSNTTYWMPGNFAATLITTDSCPTTGLPGSAWSYTTTYNAPTRVTYQGLVYQAKATSTNIPPSTSTANWLVVSPSYSINITYESGYPHVAQTWVVPTGGPWTIDQVVVATSPLPSVPVPGPPGTNGLADPGSNGVVNRTALDTTAPATAHNLSTPKVCADNSGSSTAQSCNTSPIFTPSNGDQITYTTTTANSGLLTLAVNGTSAVPVFKNGGYPLLAGDVPNYIPLTFTYYSTCNTSFGLPCWLTATIGPSYPGGISEINNVSTCAYASIPGSGTTQSCTISPEFPQPGNVFYFLTSVGNTGDLTININGAGPLHVKKNQGQDLLVSGDILPYQNQLMALNVDGWIDLLTPPQNPSFSTIKVSNVNAGSINVPLTGVVRGNGTVLSAAELSGDAVTSGSNAVTVKGLNGTLLSGLATGVLQNTTTTGVPTIFAPVANQIPYGVTGGFQQSSRLTFDTIIGLLAVGGGTSSVSKITFTGNEAGGSTDWKIGQGNPGVSNAGWNIQDTTSSITPFAVNSADQIVISTALGIGALSMTPATALHVLNSIRSGSGSTLGCIEILDSTGNSVVNYLTASAGALTVSTTKPTGCQ